MTLGGGWYYNSVSGSVIFQPPLLGLPQGLLPDWSGPFASQQDAIAFGEQQAREGKGSAPTGLAGNVANTVTSGVNNAAKDAASGLSSTVLGPLFQANLWLRIGEFTVGVVLLAIGINALFKNAPLKIITAPVGAVGKVVP